VDTHPGLAARLRHQQQVVKKKSQQSTDHLRAPSTRRARRSIRSGYAFAHQEGFGRLITSGKIMRKIPNPDFSFSSFGGKFTSTNAKDRDKDKDKTTDKATEGTSNAAMEATLRAPCQDLDTINL
jgi:phospholipid-translocating ATPase